MDHMTKLNNRRTFDEHMDKREHEKPADDFVFLSFDVNELKEANDTHGHEAGDELIIGAANCMKEVLGPYGELYRTGGDEFAALVFLPADSRKEIIRKLKESFKNYRTTNYKGISISMGYVCANEGADMSLEDMRLEAEKRMYAQKTDYYMQEGHDRRRR